MLGAVYLQCLVFAIPEPTCCVIAMLGVRGCMILMLGARGCVFAISEPACCMRDAWCGVFAVLAAPASATLAGYLSLMEQPSPVIIGILFGVSVLMTSVIYCAFFNLLRLPFSAGFAAYTFPMVIGSTALYKLAHWMEYQGIPNKYVIQINGLAYFELIIATSVVAYVGVRYMTFYCSNLKEAY